MNPRTLTVIGVLIAGVIIGIGGTYFVMRSTSDPTAASSHGTATDGRKVLYWHDPMVPGTKFDKPGKSPFMDMDLVPVYAGEEGGAAVKVSSTVIQNLGIRLGTVERTALQPHLSAVGSVAFDEHLLEVVQSRVEGYVTRLRVKAPLDRVQRGQPLADIVAPAWLEAQAEYLELLDAQSARGQSIRDAARQRLVVLGVPESTIRDLERERKTKATTTVVAPIDGVITELAVREGAAFMAGCSAISHQWPEHRVGQRAGTRGASLDDPDGIERRRTRDGLARCRCSRAAWRRCCRRSIRKPARSRSAS